MSLSLIFDQKCVDLISSLVHFKRLLHTIYPRVVESPKMKLLQCYLSHKTTLIKETLAMWVFHSVNPILSQAVQRALRVLVVVVHMADKHRAETVLREKRRDWVNYFFK